MHKKHHMNKNYYFSQIYNFVLSWYNIKMVKLTREEYNLIAKSRGIKEPQNMSTKKLINKLNRHDNKRKHKKYQEQE